MYQGIVLSHSIALICYFSIDCFQTQQQSRPHTSSFSSGGTFKRKSSKKRKSIRAEKDRKSMLAESLISTMPLAQLEPLPSSGETMKLSAFVKKFSHYLPLCVRVDEGYCGTEERLVGIRKYWKWWIRLTKPRLTL